MSKTFTPRLMFDDLTIVIFREGKAISSTACSFVKAGGCTENVRPHLGARLPAKVDQQTFSLRKIDHDIAF